MADENEFTIWAPGVDGFLEPTRNTGLGKIMNDAIHKWHKLLADKKKNPEDTVRKYKDAYEATALPEGYADIPMPSRVLTAAEVYTFKGKCLCMTGDLFGATQHFEDAIGAYRATIRAMENATRG
jgi:hypothetical protein